MGALASYPQELESGGDLSHQYQDTQLGKDAHRHTDWKGEWLLCAKVPGFSAAPLDAPPPESIPAIEGGCFLGWSCLLSFNHTVIGVSPLIRTHSLKKKYTPFSYIIISYEYNPV